VATGGGSGMKHYEVNVDVNVDVVEWLIDLGWVVMRFAGAETHPTQWSAKWSWMRRFGYVMGN
jgi:hypothetical protein